MSDLPQGTSEQPSIPFDVIEAAKPEGTSLKSLEADLLALSDSAFESEIRNIAVIARALAASSLPLFKSAYSELPADIESFIRDVRAKRSKPVDDMPLAPALTTSAPAPIPETPVLIDAKLPEKVSIGLGKLQRDALLESKNRPGGSHYEPRGKQLVIDLINATNEGKLVLGEKAKISIIDSTQPIDIEASALLRIYSNTREYYLNKKDFKELDAMNMHDILMLTDLATYVGDVELAEHLLNITKQRSEWILTLDETTPYPNKEDYDFLSSGYAYTNNIHLANIVSTLSELEASARSKVDTLIRQILDLYTDPKLFNYYYNLQKNIGDLINKIVTDLGKDTAKSFVDKLVVAWNKAAQKQIATDSYKADHIVRIDGLTILIEQGSNPAWVNEEAVQSLLNARKKVEQLSF